MTKIFTLLRMLLICISLSSSYISAFCQSTLAVGDISIIGFNANAPDNFAFVSWVPLQNDTYIKFTDNGFLSSGSANATNNGRGGENFVIWRNNTGSTIAAGTVIQIQALTTTLGVATAGSTNGLDGISASGDQIFAYQGSATSGINPDWSSNVNPTTFNGTILYGLTFQGSGSVTSWIITGTPNANISYLPSELNASNGNIAIASSASRGEYTGSRSNQSTLSAYKALVNNVANWTTASGAGTLSLNTTNFTTSALPTVNLTVSANSGTEAAQTVITVTATASSAVTGNQTVDLGVSGTNITVGDYTLSNTTITIPNGFTTGSVTFTVVDDVLVEATETAVLTISNPSSGITLGSPITQNISIVDNDTPPPPTVNLSVNTNTASEANFTVVTATATASAPVTGNQTVTLGVSGAGITVADYVLSSTTITILNGATTGTATFTVRNDAETEGTETAVLTISSPSAGITLGSPTIQNVTITDNVCQPLIRKSTVASVNGAEISAYDSASKRVYTVAGPAIEYYTLNNLGVLTVPTSMPFGFTVGTNTILPNSVAIKNGIVAVGYAVVDPLSLAQQQGVVAFYNASNATYLNHVTVGYLPDMIIFNTNGTKIITANEGEPNSYGQGNSFDPEGSVSIIDISGGVASATVQTAGFTGFNGQAASLRAAGVRLYGPGATVAQDVEPEYIALSPDESTAYITLQENNAIAVLDIASATITNILPLGLKDHSLPGNGLDASDQDVAPNRINIQNWPIKGMYMPDAIAQYSVGGNTYYITANEGDSRAYTGYSEEIRVGNAGYVLDPTVFPTAATLKLNANLGRLQLSNATGDTDSDGDFDEIHALGARSFSIWNSSFLQIFDSGDQLEQITKTQNPANFNSDGTTATFDTRSDNKGPEPEGVAIGMVNGVQYAFVGSERTGDIFVYDITNPAAPVFKQYIDHPADLQVEGVLFIPANQSPTGKALVIVSAEISRTVTVYEFSLVPNSLATTFTSITANQQNTTSYGDCSGLVAKVTQSGASAISGSVTSNVWIEPTVPTYNTVPFVQRHYEITPATNAATATGTVTLYFTQAEFDNFNADPASALDLPTGPADATGISNVRVIKYAGVSGDGTGLPGSYSSSPIGINPDDANIVWNTTDNRWEVSFDVTGFSGFFVQTNTSVLPLSLLSFTAKAQGNNTLVEWKTANEISHNYYEVLYSIDGTNFISVGQRNPLAGSGEKAYTFTHTNAALLNGKMYYRLKMVSTTGVVMYSNIIIVRFGKQAEGITDVYPNPTSGLVTLISNVNAFHLKLIDATGRIIMNKQVNVANNYSIDLTHNAKGLYILEVTLANGNKQQFKIMKK